MQRPIGAWIGLLSLLLTAQTVSAFFGSLKDLRSEFESLEGAKGGELNQILHDLDSVSGTVRFKDIAEDAWFHRYVSSVARWGIVSGYRDESGNLSGEYGPGNPVTIAEVLKMTLRSAEVDEKNCSMSPRLIQAQSHWARAFVACAEERGFRLVKSQVDLDRPATRSEVVASIHDAFADRVPPLLSTFKDTAGHTLEPDIAFASALGIVSGDTDSMGVPLGTFRPDDSVNRAEVAKILYEKLRVEVMGEG